MPMHEVEAMARSELPVRPDPAGGGIAIPAAEPLRVVVGELAAVNRHLVRHFLQGSGFEVVGEASRPDELVSLAGTVAPDAIVVGHEPGAFDAIAALPEVRRAAPGARIALFLPPGEAPPIDLPFRGADVYLEQGVGLKDLAFVLRSLCPGPFVAIDDAADGEPPRAVDGGRVELADPTGPRRFPRVRRFLLAPSVAAIVLAAGAAWAFRTAVVPGPREAAPAAPSAPAPEVRGVGLLPVERALDGLAAAIREGRPRRVAALARSLFRARLVAVEAGVDPAVLDARVRARLRPLLRSAPPDVTLVLRAVLGDVLGWGPVHGGGEGPAGGTPGPGSLDQVPAGGGSVAGGEGAGGTSVGPDGGAAEEDEGSGDGSPPGGPPYGKAKGHEKDKARGKAVGHDRETGASSR
jgi:hypothetical protein